VQTPLQQLVPVSHVAPGPPHFPGAQKPTLTSQVWSKLQSASVTHAVVVMQIPALVSHVSPAVQLESLVHGTPSTQSPMVTSQVWPWAHSVSSTQCPPEVQQALAVSHTTPIGQSESLLQAATQEPPGTQTPVVVSHVPFAQSASLVHGGTPAPPPAPPSRMTFPPQAAHARASAEARAMETNLRMRGASGKGASHQA
jgi:hypothetical protein